MACRLKQCHNVVKKVPTWGREKNTSSRGSRYKAGRVNGCKRRKEILWRIF